jgi:protein TonB
MAAQRSAFPRPARGPPRLREGAAPVRDRLLATLFLVALLHGIVILGLTFGGSGRPGGLAPGLEVLLVSDEVPTADRNDSAAYLAQRTQLGSGTAIDARSPRSPRAANGVVADRGDGPADAAHPRGANDADSDERIIASSAQRLVVRLFWRGKVERIGTLNYPTAARRAGLVANPTLEVTIAADGRLAAATVRTSSGFPELDQAAIDILKLASPFDPFPSDLAARYATLRFAYEWQFVAGQVERGTVTAPVDSP